MSEEQYIESEIQDVAKAMKKIANELFPWTFEAFNKFKFKIIEE